MLLVFGALLNAKCRPRFGRGLACLGLRLVGRHRYVDDAHLKRGLGSLLSLQEMLQVVAL